MEGALGCTGGSKIGSWCDSKKSWIWNILVAVISDGIGARQVTVDCFIVAVATIALSKSQ
jgi:hypothetical protein